LVGNRPSHSLGDGPCFVTACTPASHPTVDVPTGIGPLGPVIAARPAPVAAEKRFGLHDEAARPAIREPVASTQVLRHRFGPLDMALEAKRFRHVSVAIP